MSGCKSYYIDLPQNTINNNYIVFDYGIYENKFLYKSNVYAKADKEVYKPFHFEVILPKNIVNWEINSNHFFFEYSDKQIIYIYSAFREESQDIGVGNWEVKEVYYTDILEYIGEYWEKRKYNEDYLYKIHTERVSQLYTNGKYKILLFNIKKDNLSFFIQCIKTLKEDNIPKLAIDKK